MRSIIPPIAAGALLGGAEGALAVAAWWMLAGPGRRGRRSAIRDTVEIAGLAAAVAYVATRSRPTGAPDSLGRWP